MGEAGKKFPMKNLILILLIIDLTAGHLSGQGKFIVFFKNKGDVSEYSPGQLLSKKTLQKRALQGIGTDLYDYPVSREYLRSLQDHDVKILNTSKWLNSHIGPDRTDN